MIIAPETEKDFPQIYLFIKKAFETAEVADGKEQDFTNALRQSKAYIPELALALKEKNKIIGFIMLTKFYINTPDGKKETLLLAPLCIDIAYRNKGLGQKLMAESFKKAKELGFKSVLLVGNPDYYSRAGFKESSLFSIKNTDGIPDKFILVKELETNALDGVSGTVSFH
ncbi:MAG: GNAT family N-acetyltransferase [Elusimicrobiaceae bacterium]